MDITSVNELGRVLRVLGEHGESLGRDTPADKFPEIAADVEKAQELLGKLTGPKPYTSCTEHPYGAVDPDAPDRCLICQTRRRRAQISGINGHPNRAEGGF